ncbi:alanine racemase [Candidatus Pantoea multigeneris]|uniref:Alanine racemase n=1 Tax=Candidatus Pantoea multigeneris TaxID=2608357 RepID=A0ABX0RFE5_9GAMM|nr:alanine racemase [Pantoea multigeneris]NIF24082.1 alanine racemase [Pantoea multigeneris]
MEFSLPREASCPLFDDRPTPYIEVNALRLQRNLAQMQHKANQAGVALRPHIKTHKSVYIAQQQIALGAQGVTASKPSEAQVFLRSGIRDILVAYPIVTASTLQPLLEEARRYQAQLTLIVATQGSVAAIAEALRVTPNDRVRVAIKVDVGLHRIGVNPEGHEALELLDALNTHHIPFAGLVAHAGHAYGAGAPDAIAQIAQQEAATLLALRERILAQGASECPLSVGSTPTALAAPVAAGVNEIRPGNYALLDLTAWRLGLCQPNELAMSVTTRVVSVNAHYIIVDAGSKMLSSDKGPHGTNASGFGIAMDANGNQWEVAKLSEEHGFLNLSGVTPEPGSLLRIYPNHSCAVMAQSNSYVLREEDGNSQLMLIDARGQFI